jgi:hypothetical protein
MFDPEQQEEKRRENGQKLNKIQLQQDQKHTNK